MYFDGKTVIVTGAARGIGKAIALSFARKGANLVLCELEQTYLQELESELKATGTAYVSVIGDVSEPETAQNAVLKAQAAFGGIDVLVNNAGINFRSSFVDLENETWLRVLNINLNGAYYFLKAVLPVMMAQKSGSVVNVSSSASKTWHANAAAAYGASKGGINALTRQLAYEMAPHGIRVNAVCPGPIETDMSKQWTAEYRQQILRKIPLGRLGKPDDVANLVSFLASDDASFITGEVVNINGGTYMD